MTASCGIDWSDDHHDVAVVNEDGKLIGKRRITDDAAGLRTVLELLADCGDTAQDPIPVAVETARGLLLSCLRTTGRRMYSINPMAVARYRERYRVARAKSDHADAVTLANILGPLPIRWTPDEVAAVPEHRRLTDGFDQEKLHR